jgi:hypothetical protein
LITTDKSERAFHFHKNTLHAENELLSGAEKSSYKEVGGSIFMRDDEFTYLSNLYIPDNFGRVTPY